MKIRLFRRRYTATGGAERYVCRLAAWLNGQGHEVGIAAEEWPDSKEGVYRVERIPARGADAYVRMCLERFGGERGILNFSLERMLRQDIYRAGDGVHAAWLERRAPYQSAVARWWSRWDRKHRCILELEKKLFQPASTQWVMANSSMVKREIIERFDYPEERIRVIHPGVNLDFFRPAADASRRRGLRRGFGLPEDEVVWCFVGSGFERKGLAWALRLAAALPQPVWLLVLGKGRRNPYVRLADDLGCGRRLFFAEEGTSALDVYQAADAFILPTIYDPCANAALEAAACGLPVITTEANGAAEWVDGVALADPRQTGPAVERCAPMVRPLELDPVRLGALRARLDERACWDATGKLIAEAFGG
ncbi:MAG: glycosyltransferase family 4 protein [Verrucomicrobiae bacterium]|nr:glycosyltransferase family 4 protein [Verrucomicrobiae bacterium]